LLEELGGTFSDVLEITVSEELGGMASDELD